MTLKERVLKYLEERRNKLLNGGVNSIPSPFPRFSSEFLGIEQGKYYIVSGSTKSAKTQIASYIFLYNSIFFAYNNPDKIRLKVFYYSLEENPEDVLQRFISHILYKFTNYEIKVSPADLQSSANIPIDEKILELLQEDRFSDIISFFEEHVEFSPSRNATGVYLEVKRYMEEHGTVHTKKKKIKDDFGVTKEVDGFDYYEPDDPNEYVLVFFDHASLTQPERGMKPKETIDKLSEYFVILRNKYGVSPILIQQQAFENENLDAIKANKLRPTSQGLADSKYPSRDCNVMLGIFSPIKFEIANYLGYDITKLKDNCRFLEVVLNRGGSAGGIIGLYFEGDVCNFQELPKPTDRAMTNIYNYSIKQRENKEKKFNKILLLFSKIYKKLRNE